VDASPLLSQHAQKSGMVDLLENIFLLQQGNSEAQLY
jgi:hypothetical protein